MATKLKGVAFVRLNASSSKVCYNLKDLENRLVYDQNHRPVLVTQTGLWVRDEKKGIVGYDKFGISDGLLYLEFAGLSREKAERFNVPQVLDRLEKLVNNYADEPITDVQEPNKEVVEDRLVRVRNYLPTGGDVEKWRPIIYAYNLSPSDETSYPSLIGSHNWVKADNFEEMRMYLHECSERIDGFVYFLRGREDFRECRDLQNAVRAKKIDGWNPGFVALSDDSEIVEAARQNGINASKKVYEKDRFVNVLYNGN